MKKTILTLALLTLGTNAADFSTCKDYEKGVDRLRCYDNIANNMSKDSKENNVKPVKGITPFVEFSYYQHERVSGLNEVRLFIGYKNKTKKRIVGIISNIKVTDVFGDVLFDVNGFKDDVNIKAGKRYKPSAYRSWNSYSSVHKKLWKPVSLGTHKTEITITKVIFADGTTLGG